MFAAFFAIACGVLIGCGKKPAPTLTPPSATIASPAPVQQPETKPTLADTVPEVPVAPSVRILPGDSGIVVISKLKMLGSQVNVNGDEVTGFGGPNVTDAALEQISHITTIKILNLANSNVTDKGMAHIANLKGLTQLNLGNTKVTERGLEVIKNFPQLETLTLFLSAVSNENLKTVGELKKLKALNISNTKKFGDEGMKYLGKLPAIEFIHLQSTAISDEGLSHLAGLKTLTRVLVTGRNVTPAGVEKLQRALPKCQVNN